MTASWFIAFPLPGGFLETLTPPPPHFRAFASSDLHCTISFLGACGGDAAEGAFDALAEEMSQVKAFAVTLGDVAPLGPKGRYSALSALLGDGQAEASDAILRLGPRASLAAGVAPDPRAPRPHVTLARPQRHATDSERQAGLAWARSLDLSHVKLTASTAALYTWSDDRSRTLFRQVRSVALQVP